MARIIYESIGPNYQVPGLPYDKTYQYVRPVVFDDVPSEEDLARVLAEADEQTLVNPLSIQAVKGMRDYIPTTFKRVTEKMPHGLHNELFGLSEDWMPEADRVLLQLQTEIEAKGATLDAAIIHDRFEQSTIVNKAHVLNRLHNIGHLYGHLAERESPFLFGDLTDPTRWYAALSEMKQMFIEYMLEVPMGERKCVVRTRKADVSPEELKEYPHIEWLKSKLGDIFVADLLYGSASRTKDKRKYKDLDNWVVVTDVAKAHELLRGTRPVVADGRVVEGASKLPQEEKERLGMKDLGIHLFPVDADPKKTHEYIKRHIRFLHDSVEFRKHTRILYGAIPFPKSEMDEVIERGVSQAYVKLKTVTGALNWAWHTPQQIYGKPNLFEFIVKNMRFFLQHSLNATGEPAFRDKQTLDKLLAERGLAIPEYADDLEHIRHSLLYSVVGVFKLQKELLEHGRTPDLEFLAHATRGTHVPQSWDAMDD